MTGGSAAAALLLAAAAASLPCLCSAHTIRFGTLEITHPVIVTPHAGETAGRAHITIRNLGTEDEVLTGAGIDGASGLELAGVSMPLRIPPGGTLELSKVCFVKFVGLSDLPEPDMGVVEGVLFFARSGPVMVDFMVDPPE